MAARKLGRYVALGGLRCRRHAVFIEAQGGVLGDLAGDGAVEHAAERIDVGPRALLAAVGGILLVGGIAGLDDAGERLAHLGDRAAGGAEIEQHGGAVGADDDVVGGDVAMQEIGRVQHLQGIEHRRHDAVELLLRGLAAEPPQPVLEAFPALEAHHHVGRVIGLEHAGDAHDAGMVEARQRARFLQEVGAAPVEDLLVALGLCPHAHRLGALAEIVGVVFLDRHHGGEADVLGLIGDAEPAGADDTQDAIAAIENRSRRQDVAATQCTSSQEGDERGTLPRIAIPRNTCAPHRSAGAQIRAISAPSPRPRPPPRRVPSRPAACPPR